jgi:predicted transcriptional regulator
VSAISEHRAAIMARIEAGHRNIDIAKEFGVSPARISQYRTGQRRSDISRRILVCDVVWKQIRDAADETGADPAVFAGRILKLAMARGAAK